MTGDAIIEIVGIKGEFEVSLFKKNKDVFEALILNKKRSFLDETDKNKNNNELMDFKKGKNPYESLNIGKYKQPNVMIIHDVPEEGMEVLIRIRQDGMSTVGQQFMLYPGKTQISVSDIHNQNYIMRCKKY